MEKTADQTLRVTNSLDFTKRCLPTMSPCGNYLAYIIRTENDLLKLIVRVITNRNYNVVLQKNLSHFLRVSIAKNQQLSTSTETSKQNNLEAFMNKHDLKSTFKTINNYMGVMSNEELNIVGDQLVKEIRPSDSAIATTTQNYIIRWAFTGSKKICNQLAIMDPDSNVVCIFDIANFDLNIVVNITDNDMKILDMRWFNELTVSVEHQRSSFSYLGIFFEDNINFKILEITDGNDASFVYEVNKPKFDKLFHRFSHLNITQKSSMISLIQADNGNDVIHTFEIIMGRYRKQLIPFSTFTLPYNVKDVKWSPTGKWFCYLSNNIELSLLNSFGLGKIENSHHKDSGCYILRKDLTDFGIYSISFIDWSFIDSSLIFPKSFRIIDNNYPILSKISEILLFGDYQGNLYILSTMPYIDKMTVLEHRTRIDLNDEMNALIQDESGSFHRIEGEFFTVLLQDPLTFDNSIYKIRCELNSKFQDLFTHQQYDFSSDYFNHCIQKNNLIAVLMKASKNAIYLWNLNDIFHTAKYQDGMNAYSSYDLTGILQTTSDILNFLWHPIFPNYLLVVTKSSVVIWNPISRLAPITVNPFLDASDAKVFQKIKNEKILPSCQIISNAKWITANSDMSDFISSFSVDNTKSFFKFYCESSHSKFVMVEIPLNEDHLNLVKAYNKGFVELFSRNDEKLFHFQDMSFNPHEGSGETSILQILLDDDTKAMKIYKTVQAEDWIQESYKSNKRIKDQEDTFGYKKKRIFSKA